jgi:hypothetical protein
MTYRRAFWRFWNAPWEHSRTPKQKPRTPGGPRGADGEAAAVIGSLRVSNIEQIFSRQPSIFSWGGVSKWGDAMPHKFKVGQTVAWERSRTSESYVVTQQLPERDGVFEYAVTNPTEPYDRVAIESELSAM